MTTPPQASRRSSPLARIIAAVAVLILAVAATALVAGTAFVRTSPPPTDNQELRAALLNAMDMPRTTDVQVTVPAWLTVLGRAGVSLAGVEPEVSDALGAFRSGQIGVYELADSPTFQQRLSLKRCADGRLEGRGWTRVVTVLDDGALVLVYVKDRGTPARCNDLEAWVIALDHRDLVMVSACARPAPLFKLASRTLDGPGFQFAGAITMPQP